MVHVPINNPFHAYEQFMVYIVRDKIKSPQQFVHLSNLLETYTVHIISQYRLIALVTAVPMFRVAVRLLISQGL